MKSALEAIRARALERLQNSETARNTCVRENRLFLCWNGCKMPRI